MNPGPSRRVRRAPLVAAVGAALAGALVLCAQAPAQAAVPDQRWSAAITSGKGSTAAVAVTWNPQSHVVTMSIGASTLPAGKCVTAFLDWRATGHHDGLAFRECATGQGDTVTFPYDGSTNLGTYPVKLGACYGSDDTRGACTFASPFLTRTVPLDWTPWPDVTRTSPCDLDWTRRNADGTLTTFVDTHPTSPKVVHGVC